MQGGISHADESTLPSRGVEELRRAYGIDDAFERELGEAWRIVEPHIAGIVRELLERRAQEPVTEDQVAQRVDYARGKLAYPIDQDWVDRIVAEGDRIARRDLDFSAVAASMLVAQMRIHHLFFELSNDPAELERLTRATQKLAVIEVEIIVSRLQGIAQGRAQAALRVQAAQVRAELGDTIAESARVSRDIARFTGNSAAELQALRAPAMEVASAAGQSAAAMSQSAASAAALVEAYGRTREEARGAAEAGTRASAVAADGAAAAARLSAQAARIGSVVTYIARLAEQTQTLAINASIEAARAGESGRGFAVVAQEVRTLADQASEATGSVAETIRDTQEASTKASLTSTEVQEIVAALAARVNAANDTIDAQSEIMGTILASIDETAMSSRGIATHIADISTRIDLLAGAADQAGRQAVEAGAALQQIEATVGQFISGVTE